jgi:hypothetical protein
MLQRVERATDERARDFDLVGGAGQRRRRLERRGGVE